MTVWHFLLRQGRSCSAEGEGRRSGELEPIGDRAGVAPEARGHLRTAAQMCSSVGRKPAVELVHAAHSAHSGDRLGE